MLKQRVQGNDEEAARDPHSTHIQHGAIDDDVRGAAQSGCGGHDVVRELAVVDQTNVEGKQAQPRQAEGHHPEFDAGVRKQVGEYRPRRDAQCEKRQEHDVQRLIAVDEQLHKVGQLRHHHRAQKPKPRDPNNG